MINPSEINLSKSTIATLIQSALIALSLAACVAMPGDGAMGDRPAAPVPMAPPPGVQQPIKGEYLEDPEGETEDWSNSTLADSLQEAETACRAYAQREGVIFVKAERRTQKGRTYDCYFRSRS